jgi:integrative and conjugative element protein (TIGR02256 family)
LQRLRTAQPSLSFDVGQSGQQLVMPPEVLEILAQHQQRRPKDREAGGQLFGRLAENTVTVVRATGPRPTDIRTRYSYQPDRKAEQAEIDDAHRRGLFFLGDWHTHPESVPNPSPQDLHSITESFKKSTHHLNGFLLVIAGTQRLPSGLYVAVHNDKEAVRLLPRTRASCAKQAAMKEDAHGKTR